MPDYRRTTTSATLLSISTDARDTTLYLEVAWLKTLKCLRVKRNHFIDHDLERLRPIRQINAHHPRYWGMITYRGVGPSVAPYNAGEAEGELPRES
ncbi:unnamed protein product [Dovyalis caffra]|uniref:Uncharacterized protein n=1 Tax=Dovyalis caffra TaxID=77055 RepID=A0AAV1SGZ9_9ROSI|nr:unnamed protein product [Dovyalis caffra]